MLIGIVSAKGSPGVTTAALALASCWPRAALVVEADPFGGDVRAGLGAGQWPPAAGLGDLVVDLRSVGLGQALDQRAHRPADHAPPVLAGLGSVGQAANVPWSALGAGLALLTGVDVVADCGRFVSPGGVEPLLRACDALVLVTRSSLRAARAAARVTALLRESLGVAGNDPRVSVVVVAANRPYSAAEIAEGCGLPLLGELPHDPRAAAVWSDGFAPGRGFPRSALQREAARLAVRIAGLGGGAVGAA